MFRLICLFFVSVPFIAGQVGCNQSSSNVDPAELAKHRAKLLLEDEPDGVQTVLDVREALLGEDDQAEHDHDEHDHNEHAEHDHDGEDHDEHAEHDHAEHDHDDEDHDEHAEHAEHDHDDEDHDEHAEHDHDDEDHDEHAEHDHDEQGHDEHAGHDHDEREDDSSVAVVHATEPIDVVLVGQVGGLANPWKETQPEFPFASGRAQFFLADPGGVAEIEASGHVHAPGEECAFCEANAADNSAMLALVRFVGQNDHVLPIDARQLFDINDRDTVVVRGTARVIEGGMMVVDATGLYVRR